MTTYVINGFPLGLNAPRSANETILGLRVSAQKVGDKIIVARNEFLERIAQKKSMFLDFWKANKKIEQFEFQVSDCTEC